MTTGPVPAALFGQRVEIARKNRGWKQSDLVDRLAELGFTQWRQSKVAKIENGEVKRLALEDALALTAALGVQLVHLLAPDDGDVQITPKMTLAAATYRKWLRGHLPLNEGDQKTYWTGALVPEQEWREFVQGVAVAGAHIVASGAQIATAPAKAGFKLGDGKRAEGKASDDAS